MASPVIDGHAKNITWPHLATSGTVTIVSTANAVDMVSLFVIIENVAAAISVSSVSSTSGLTWTRRTTQTNPTNHVVVEEWSAPTSSVLSNEVITVNVSAAPDSVVLVAFGVHGVFSTATPFDSNVSLPAVGIANAAVATATYSTTQADDLLLACYATNSSAGITAPTGWTLVDGGTNSNAGGLRFCLGVVYSKSVSAAQTSQTFTTPSNGTNNVALVDAMTADSSGGETATGALAFGPVQFGGSSVADKSIFITSGTTWAVPSDWNSAANTVRAFGAGGNGAAGAINGASGGGGGSGGFSQALNVVLVPGSTATVQIGAAGGGNAAGNDTFLKDTGGTTWVLAQSASSASANTAGNGAASGRSVGSTVFGGRAGGAASATTGAGGGGGGGASGPAGLGGTAPGSALGHNGGSGGSGANAGSATNGLAGTTTTGGAGGTGPLGDAGGTGGTAVAAAGNGVNGSGGGGGSVAFPTGANGSQETLYTATAGGTAGPGSGGGGGGNGATAGAGGNAGGFGAGGAGGAANATTAGAAGAGAPGIIVVTYTPAYTETSTGTIAFGPVRFSAAAIMENAGNGVLAFGPVRFAGTTHKVETGSGAVAFGPVKFNAAGTDTKIERGVGVLAFTGFAIHALGADLGKIPASGVTAAKAVASQTLQPLTWDVPVALNNGAPTPEFQRKWQRNINIFNAQLKVNSTITSQGYIDAQDKATLAASQTTAQQLVDGRALPGAILVAGLPASPPPNTRALVKDSTQTLAAGLGTSVVGGSTNITPVYYDGTAWKIG